jgi:hypothetical protein
MTTNTVMIATRTTAASASTKMEYKLIPASTHQADQQ